MYIPSILQNRAYLIIIIGFLTTITALGPFFVGYTFTTILAVHEILHIAAITFGVFLMLVSIFAYDTTRNTNMIFTALAFLTFTLLSIFLLEEDFTTDLAEHKEAVIVDVLLTVMVGLFAIGVFYNQKFPNRTKYS